MSRESLDTRLLIVSSEDPIKAERARPIVDFLRSHWKHDIVEAPTKYRKATDNIHDLRDKVRDGDTVFTFGGDGQLNIGLNGVKQSEREARLATVPCGNANDFAKENYGEDITEQERLYSLVKHGRTKTFGGIRVDGLSERLYGATSAALGNSARVIRKVGGNEFRAHIAAHPHRPQIVMESWATLRTSLKKETFEYSEAGERHRAVGMDFVTGRLMAKLMHFNLPPYGQEMTNIEVSPVLFRTNLAWQAVKGGLLHGIRGNQVDHREVTLLSPATFHLDGEDQELEPGITMTFTHDPNMANFLLPEETAA